MEVLTIRDVFILNFAPVSLSVSPPRTPRVCHAFQQQATDNCRVGQTATQDMSCMQSKVCSTAQELTSTARGTLFTSSPRSQHSGIVRKQQVFSSSESVLAIGGMLQMLMHSWSILSETECDGTQKFFRYRDRYFFPGPIFSGTGTGTIQKKGEFPGPGQNRYHMGLF